jgi:esterase/lipase
MIDLKIENINIPINLDNIKLKGSIYSTSNTPSKAPWIIILGGFLEHRGSTFVKIYIEKFAGAGYYVLSYDYRGHGEDKININKLELYKKTPKIFSDINNVIDWVLENQAYRLLEEKIVLFGRSYGGAIVLTSGYIDKRVNFIVALCARYDYMTVQLKIPDILKKSMSKLISPKYFLKRDLSNNKRILIAHCKDDKRIPFKNVLQIKDHLGLSDNNVLIYETGGHSFEGHKDHLFIHTIEFLKKL